jgi:hypothetical protein
MKPQVTILTLCVDDLERSVAFCTDGLGFAARGIIATAFEHEVAHVPGFEALG